MSNKQEQRKKVRQLRLGINKELYQTYSDIICNKIIEMKDYINADTVLAYCPIHNEVDTSLILDDCIQNKNLALPKTIVNEKRIIPCYVNALSDLKERTFSIVEPNKNCREVLIEKIDFIVIPLVAFDKYGTRLGYGGGYYDKLLSGAFSCKKVGLAFSIQELDYIQDEKHDIKLDMIVTEKNVFNF